MSAWFQRPRPPRKNDYYLLIDQPWLDNPYFDMSMPREQLLDFYKTLIEFCQERGKKLVVKLHPESYGATWLPEHPLIEWVEDADIFTLVSEAIGVFGNNSTLMLLALYLGPCYLVDFNHNRFVGATIASGLANGTSLQDLTARDIKFPEFNPNSRSYQDFVENYLGPERGNSIERLAQILDS